MKFDISYGPFSLFILSLFGLGPSFSGVTVDEESIKVRMGWAFRVTFPRSSVAGLSRARIYRYGIGVHGWRGTWVVNGRYDVLWLDIEPPARGRMTGFPVEVRRLGVSLEDPDGFAAALQLPIAAA